MGGLTALKIKMELLKVSMSRNDQDKKFKTTMTCIFGSSDTYQHSETNQFKRVSTAGRIISSSEGTDLHDAAPKQTKEHEQAPISKQVVG